MIIFLHLTLPSLKTFLQAQLEGKGARHGGAGSQGGSQPNSRPPSSHSFNGFVGLGSSAMGMKRAAEIAPEGGPQRKMPATEMMLMNGISAGLVSESLSYASIQPA